jgi:phosphatidylglycerol:prolipoprotein diacylglycerol transferase
MHPIIVKLGPVTIYSYGMMVAIAFLFGIYLARIEAIRKNVSADLIYDLTFYVIVGSLIGARVYYILFFDPRSFIENPVELFKIWKGGLAIHGGILGGIIGGFIFSRLRKFSFWKLADIVSPSILLGQAIGRLGCFLNGCCFGVPTQSIFGVHFPKDSLAWIAYGGLSVHPTQLYEMILNFIGFLVLWILRHKIRFDGGLFLVYLMMYNCIRIAIAGLRGDSLYIWNTGLKVAYIVSAAIFVVALIIFIKKRKNA